MTGDLARNCLTLLGLALLGVGVAVSGSAFGIDGPLADSEESTEFTVDDDGITVSDGQDEYTVIENLTKNEAVEITADNDELRVQTRQADGFSDDVQERAVTIAHNNETIRQSLGNLDDYEFVIQPSYEIDHRPPDGITVHEADRNVTSSDDNDGVPVNEAEVEHDDTGSSVTVHIPPSSDNRVSVAIYDNAGELQYSLVVDLDTDEVVQLIEA